VCGETLQPGAEMDKKMNKKPHFKAINLPHSRQSEGDGSEVKIGQKDKGRRKSAAIHLGCSAISVKVP